jgi:GT2 family glycosyltransferase
MAIVSIVILSYNRKEDIRESLEKLYSYGLNDIEIIVVDNGSSDGTSQMIESEYPSVRLLKLDKNIGVSGYNKGFEISKGRYILILDDDSFPSENSVKRMIEEFEKDETVGIIAFDVRNYSSYNLVSNQTKKEEQTENKRYLMGFNGAGAGIRKSLIDKIGGYPDEFFLYWNETDLAIRVLNEGYKILWVNDIISYHKYSPKNRDSERGPYYYTRNLYWIILKYFPLFKGIGKILKLLYYSFYFGLEQKTFIYLKASFNAVFNSKTALKKRKKIKKEIIENIRIEYRLPFIIYR